jgi:hypothetical protein
VIGVEPGEPQAQVAEVRPQQKSATTGRRRRVSHDVGQVAVCLVVEAADAIRPVAQTELQYESPQIVAQPFTLDSHPAKRMPYHDVDEQRRRRLPQARRLAQQLREIGCIE